MKTSALVGGLLLSTLTFACGSADLTNAPSDSTGPSAPSQPPPTGTKWEGKEATDGCGREGVVWALVDETCGGTSQPGYLESFRVPMFRDGAAAGSNLYAVDATHLWVLDVQDPINIWRKALVAGLGEPLAIQSQGERLVLASALAGLVFVDVTQPAAPKRTSSTPLPGPALDVYVDGARAWVAMGKAGVGEVDISTDPPKLVRTLPLSGVPEAYAAGITTRGPIGYVAACSSLVTVDLQSGQVLGSAWLPNAWNDAILVAPAKDVEVVGDRAFVAAGRFGAVAVDVSVPSEPQVQGNCTFPQDLSFYASGVRAQGGRLFIAGGEWGIFSIDVNNPSGACPSSVEPALPKSGAIDETECTAQPPWQVLPWEDLWAPPPPKKDPIQVLPVDGRLYAFGDARRVGLRAVDIREPAGLEMMGRYDEPRRVIGVAASQGRVAAWGTGGGLYKRDEAELLVADSATAIPLAAVTAGSFLADGRLVVTYAQSIFVEGWNGKLELPNKAWTQSLATSGQQAFIPSRNGVLSVQVGPEGGKLLDVMGSSTSELPASVSAWGDEVFLASPEWLGAQRLAAGQFSNMTDHGVFDQQQVNNLALWYQGLPRRMLTGTGKGLIEVATLGRIAGLTLHTPSDEVRGTSLPSGTYVGVAAVEQQVYLVSTDRGLYQSQLLTVNLASGLPQLMSTDSFTGVAMGVAADGDRVYVADANQGIRVYARGPKSTALLGIVSKGVEP